LIARIDAALPRAAWTGRIVAAAVEPDPIEAIDREADAELDRALYLVPTVDDVGALQALGFLAQLAGEQAAVPLSVGLLSVEHEPLLVAVGAVPLALLREIREQVPTCTVRTLPGVASVAAALGYCGSIGWPDRELDAHRRTWLAIAREARVELPAADAEPRDDSSTDCQPFPLDELPAAVRRIVAEGAAAQGIDVAYWAVPSLAILAGCVGATRRVRIKRSWSEPCVLWTAVIAPSGAGKSPSLRELLEPVRAHDQAMHDRATAMQQAADAGAAAEGKRAEQVPARCALVDNVTVEALGVRLDTNRRGLLLAADELASWIKAWDAYRSGGDEQAWLSMHDAGPLRIDRKSTEPRRILVPAAAVSVTGTIQPAIAARYLGAAERRSSGAAARLLLALPPVARVQWTDDDVTVEAREGWGFIVRSLLDLALDDEGRGIELPLDPEAHAMFREFVNENGDSAHRSIVSGEHDLAAALAKHRGSAARLALALALARAAEDGTASLLPSIDGRAMRAGITLARWFGSESRRVYETWDRADAERTAGSDRQTLHELADRLHEALADGPKSLEQLHAATHRNHTAARIAGALAVLRASGRASSERLPAGPRGGRPRETWRSTGGVTS
jgi:hypothetical protein